MPLVLLLAFPSTRYELTGGYIKNALVSALLLAISRSADDPKVTEDDIVAGCQMQMRGSLQMKAFLHRVVPKTGLDDLVLSAQMRKQVGILSLSVPYYHPQVAIAF